jgi:hypothetical protein
MSMSLSDRKAIPGALGNAYLAERGLPEFPVDDGTSHRNMAHTALHWRPFADKGSRFRARRRGPWGRLYGCSSARYRSAVAVMTVGNSFTGWLCLWLEPLGEDRWLRSGETFRISSDYDGDKADFHVDYWVGDEDRAVGIENVTVWIQYGNPYAEVTDGLGNLVECGHQRPPEVAAKWAATRLAEPRSARTSGQPGEDESAPGVDHARALGLHTQKPSG